MVPSFEPQRVVGNGGELAADRAVAWSRRGLTDDAARARLADAGPNRFVPRRRWSEIYEFLATLADPQALMLAAGSIIYFALDDSRDAIILALALIPVLAVDVALEARSRRALAKLASAVAPRTRLIRDGVEREVETESVVPGDLLVLREGCGVHGDGIVIEAANLALDESQLTGEAEPQPKRPHVGATLDAAVDAERFFAGSIVIAGHGLGLVAETGPRTRYGQIGRQVAESRPHATPLQRAIATVVRRFALGAAGVVALVMALELARGASWSVALISAVSLAMSAAPEEFPLVFTLFLALGAWRLARRGVLVRQLASVETLGSTSVMCVDKTGTLTHGKFTLEHHRVLADGGTEDELLECAALACELNPADPLERAIVDHCSQHGIDVAALHRRWSLVHDYDFDPLGKHMSHVWRSDDGRERIVAKGALEGVLEHASSSAEAIARAESVVRELAARGVRVLAVAERRFAHGTRATGVRAADERDLALVGLVGFHDPLRKEVPDAIAECRRAGIAIKLITGDHALTAHAIASAAGIAGDDPDDVVLGARIDELSARELAAVAVRATTFARVRPEQKLAIVEALRSAGESVAMTGDGINDAPALRHADIGVSMGRGATEVARSAANLVLLENDFTALVAAVREGRSIFVNVQRAFLYLIAFHVPVIGLALCAPLFGWPLILLPVHIIWLELIVHPVSALLFENAPPPPDSMLRPPRKPGAPLLARGRIARSAITGALLTIAALALYAIRYRVDVEEARAAALVVVIVGNLILVWAERAIDRPWWTLELPRTLRFWLVYAAVAASLPVCLCVPVLAQTLHVAPPPPGDLAIAMAAAVVCVAWRLVGFRDGPSTPTARSRRGARATG
jgi:Ca2+-transporting ATPase